MSAPRVYTIKSISTFAGRIEKELHSVRKRSPDIPSALNWYRGHSASSSYRLRPYLYRHKTIVGADDLLDLEEKMMTAFQRQAMLHAYKGGIDDAKARTELLFYMQHYGVPTRLLDWSSNPFIALYFALSRAKRDKTTSTYMDAAALWILDPFAWNRYALAELGWKDSGPANAEDPRIISYLPQLAGRTAIGSKYTMPIALTGSVNTARMMAQRGNFAIFNGDTQPMETLYTNKKFERGCLVKLEIPAVFIGTLLHDLIALGYTDSVAYPDLEGLAMEVKRMHGFDV